MAKVVGYLALLLSAILLIPAGSVGQQKNNNQKKDIVTKEETTPQDYLSLASLKEVVGKIAEFDLKAGTMTFTLAWSHWEPKSNIDASTYAKANQQLQQQLMREYNKIMLAKNPIQQQQALMLYQARLQQLQASAGVNFQKMFRIVKSSKDFELKLTDKINVGRAKLEEKYTDEGEFIKYTDAEIKKMKSADIRGAFTAAPTDLKNGQTVKLYLKPPKKQDVKKPEGSTTGDADAKDQQTADRKIARPQVRMVLIMEEPITEDLPDATKKKKKG